MKARLIKKQTIENYVKSNVQSKPSFEKWLAIIKQVRWEKPQDIVSTFNSADILGSNSERVVFNIGGNKYRMICKYQFWNDGVSIYVKWIGTHSEYDKLCKESKQYTVNMY